MLVMDVPGGIVLRRLGQKRAMIAGITIMLAGTLALALAQSIHMAFFLRFATGAGASIMGLARHAYLAENIPLARRGRAVSWMGGLFRVGRFLGPSIGGVAADAFGLRVPFLLMGGLFLLGVGMVAVFMPESAATMTQEAVTLSEYNRKLAHTARAGWRVLATVGAGQLFAQMVRSGPSALIPLFGADVLGLDATTIGFVLSAGAAVDMLLFIPAGQVMDRLGRKFAIVPSFALQGAGLMLLGLVSSAGGLALVAGIIGLSNGISAGSMMTLGADFAPPAERGEFLAMWRLLGDSGSMFGPVVVGAVAAAFALPLAALAVGGSGMLASAIFALLVPETRTVPAPQAGG